MEIVNTNKWSDDEDDQNFDMRLKARQQGPALPTKLIEETDETKESAFLGWVQEPDTQEELKVTNLGGTKASSGGMVQNLLKREISVNVYESGPTKVLRIGKTKKADRLASAVNSIDFLPSRFHKNGSKGPLCMFSGLGKEIRFGRVNEKKRMVDLEGNFFFDRESFLVTRFLDENTVVSLSQRKRWVSGVFI